MNMSTDVQDVPPALGAEGNVREDSKTKEAAPVNATGEDAEGAAAEEEATKPKPKPKPKLCGICDKQDGKYKCPRCSLP